jgi:hypothetical protein
MFGRTLQNAVTIDQDSSEQQRRRRHSAQGMQAAHRQNADAAGQTYAGAREEAFRPENLYRIGQAHLQVEYRRWHAPYIDVAEGNLILNVKYLELVSHCQSMSSNASNMTMFVGVLQIEVTLRYEASHLLRANGFSLLFS